MEATLEAVRRDRFGKNEAGRHAPRGPDSGGALRRARRQAESLAVDPKALLRILHSESGVNTLIALKVDGAGDARVLVKEYQLHPVDAASCCTPTSIASRWTRCCASPCRCT